MPAPDLASLLNFAANWRAAAVAAAQAAGIPNVWTDLATGNRTTPRVEVHFVQGEPTGHKTPIPGLTPKETPHDAFNGTLTWVVVTDRTLPGNGDQHEALCAMVRALMLPFRHTFTEAILVFYDLNGAIPGRNSAMVDSEKRLDVTQMPYAIRYSIRSGAWPAFV